MNVLLPLLIVATGAVAPIEARYPGAAEVFHCAFDESWDRNFDHWPDEWSRRRDREHPHYVAVEIREEPTPVGRRCLRIDLDGGAAAVSSPPIPISPLSSYVLEGRLQTEGLEHDQAYFSLTLLNRQGSPLETFVSRKIEGSHPWEKVRVGPVAPASEKARLAQIGLHLEPGSRADLTGSARFADVWLGRLPRISLVANSTHHVFTDPQQIVVTCKVSGISQEDPPIVFRLEDAFGVRIAERRQRLKTIAAAEDDLVSLGAGLPTSPEGGSARVGSGDPRRAFVSPTRGSESPACLVGSAAWRPPVPGPGFYRVQALVHDQDEVVHRRALGLAVMEAHRGQTGSEFGWSLPRADEPLPLDVLSWLVGQAGIGWVKYPLWCDESQSDEQAEALVRFSERLTEQGVRLVGLLDGPPESLRARFPDLRSPAEIFAADPKVWSPSLQTAVTSRVGMQVRWWQLGLDTDTGFVGCPKLAERIGEIKAELDRLSYDAQVGFGWDWRRPLPDPTDGEKVPRPRERATLPGFLCLSADPPLTQEELAERLSATQSARLARWVVLEPLSRRRSSLAERMADLAGRMIAAKIHGAEGVFVPNPFSTDHGLMNDDGTAGELFLPWRTSALMLGRARCLGSIQLPGGSRNYIFTRSDDTSTGRPSGAWLGSSREERVTSPQTVPPRGTGSPAIMVLWNNTETEEVICLGPDVRQVDLWGRTTVPQRRADRQVIRVGPLPVYLTGIDERIARWRQRFVLTGDPVSGVAAGSDRLHAAAGSDRIHAVFPNGGPAGSDPTDAVLASGDVIDGMTNVETPITKPSRTTKQIGHSSLVIGHSSLHPRGFRLENCFEREVSGRLKWIVPHSWTVAPPETEFHLARGERFEQSLEITVGRRATSGRHPIRVDFEIEGDRAYQFSLYRQIEVGPDDVSIEIATRLNERGELEVEQQLTSRVPTPISFRCHLFAPNRRRQTVRVVGADAAPQVNTYRLPEGRQLIGKTLWLRAEQIEGPRVLNYRFVAERSRIDD